MLKWWNLIILRPPNTEIQYSAQITKPYQKHQLKWIRRSPFPKPNCRQKTTSYSTDEVTQNNLRNSFTGKSIPILWCKQTAFVQGESLLLLDFPWINASRNYKNNIFIIFTFTIWLIMLSKFYFISHHNLKCKST